MTEGIYPKVAGEVFYASEANLIGGDSSDGALTVTGITTISTAAGPVIKNYSSLTIDAGAILTKSADGNPLIIKVRGNLTINGKVNMNAKGCAGGHSDINVGGVSGEGIGGGRAIGGKDNANRQAIGGSVFLYPLAPLGGVIYCGSGGSNGVGVDGQPGDGGRGAGSIYFEVLGNVTLAATAELDFRGGAGTDDWQGGGGGGGGLCIIAYAGTYTDNGALLEFTGGAGGTGDRGIGGAGGAGYFSGSANSGFNGGAGGDGLYRYVKVLGLG